MDVDAILDKLAPVYDHYVWPTTHEECMAQGSMDVIMSSSIAAHVLQLRGASPI